MYDVYSVGVFENYCRYVESMKTRVIVEKMRRVLSGEGLFKINHWQVLAGILKSSAFPKFTLHGTRAHSPASTC
jgi:hypothetical protein